MKKLLSFVLALSFLIPCFFIEAGALSARSAVLLNGDTGEIIYSVNSGERLPMASTTKIMTALLLCESGQLDRSITVTEEMVKVEGSSMGLLPGDTVSLHDLLYGLLLASGNDAANTVAIVLGGSVEGFAEMMNERARQMGLKDTNFVTPSGLDADEHYTTAYELAIIARYAMQNEDFAKAAGSKSAVLNYGNPPYRRTLTNHNKLLSRYEGVIGVKTGFTKKSGRCLVSAAERNGEYLIAVTLNAPDDWNDHITLLDLGFSSLKEIKVEPDLSDYTVRVIGGNRNTVAISADTFESAVLEGSAVSYDIICPDFVYAPVALGETIGEVRYYVGDELIKTEAITANTEVFQIKQDKKKAVLQLFKYIISFV